MTLPTYDTHVRPFAKNFTKIKMSDEDIKKANKWALDMQLAKLPEYYITMDIYSSHRRLFNGIIGEMAVEKLIGKEFIDWSIGDSKNYRSPDLKSLGYEIGIKTSEYGRFSVIYKKNEYPQIFVIYRPIDQTAFVCGIADIQTLDTYQSDELLISPALKAKKIKTGFYGFEFLKPITEIITVCEGS